MVGRVAAWGVGEREGETVALAGAVPLVGGGSRRVEDDAGRLDESCWSSVSIG